MVSMQRVLSAVLISAVLVLPFVGYAAASESPPEVSKAQETPKERQDVAVPTLSVWELPSAPAKAPVSKPVRTAKAKVQAPAKQYVCSGWQDSQVGGQYRACGWQ